MTKQIKNIVILLCVILFSINIASAQSFNDKYGKGMVVFEYDTNTVLNFYNNPNEGDPSLNISVRIDADSKQLTLKLTDEQKQWFNPETFWDEEKLLHFICTERKGNWCKIIVDKKTNKAFWVLTGLRLHFFKWKKYLPNTSQIEVLDTINNKAKYIRCFLSPSVKNRPYRCLRIQKVKGNKALVEFDKRNCPDFDKNSFVKPVYGWIRWRDKKGLLINYYLR